MAVKLALVMACAAAIGVAQLPPRDRAPARADATGRIAGVVLSDEITPRPLRRAWVMLSGDLPGSGQTVITEDDGTFAFEGLAAGRYTVVAVKPAYVEMQYGARRPGRRGLPIQLRDGETRPIELKLPRGAVITGVVTDLLGQPAAGVVVQALDARIGASGPRSLQRATTDDRGAYRIFGLHAGSYVIAMQPHIPSNIMMTGDTRGFAPVPVYYPSTTDTADAARLKVAAGEERTDIDLQMQLVPTATVSGTVPVPPDGHPMPAVRLVTRSARSFGVRSTRSASGQFTFRGIRPGQYTVSMTSGGQLFTADITVDGSDISGLVLAPQPVLTISGRVVFEGSAEPTLASPLQLPLDLALGVERRGVTAELQPDGRFRIGQVFPGKYEISTGRGLRVPIGKWWIKSVAARGRELLDGPVDLQESLTDVVVTLSDRTNELSGIVRDAQGNPRPDVSVIAFAPVRAAWFYNSRRVAGMDTDISGRYTIRNLPPGEYYLIATDEIERLEWFDPEVLEGLVPRAMRISMGENERRTQDVIVR